MRTRTIVTPLVIVALALSLTGCGAGSNASTRLIKKVTDGQEGGINKDDNNISYVISYSSLNLMVQQS